MSTGFMRIRLTSSVSASDQSVALPNPVSASLISHARAIINVFGAIHEGGPTNDLIAIKYLEALQAIADGKASKVFLPLEVSGVLGSIGGVAELFEARRPKDAATVSEIDGRIRIEATVNNISNATINPTPNQGTGQGQET